MKFIDLPVAVNAVIPERTFLEKICLLPEPVIGQWRKDYEAMQEVMIYGESLPFDALINRITELNECLVNNF